MNVPAPSRPAETVVADASTLVELLADLVYPPAVARRLRCTLMHAPAHLEAEVLSALGRLHRAGELAAADVDTGLARLASLPVQRHRVSDLLAGAWARRADVRLADALYVEVATKLHAPLLTTDQRLARACGVAEAISDA